MFLLIILNVVTFGFKYEPFPELLWDNTVLYGAFFSGVCSSSFISKHKIQKWDWKIAVYTRVHRVFT
jgi:uncharacterized membrane protein YsdA (DUF1294 family)